MQKNTSFKLYPKALNSSCTILFLMAKKGSIFQFTTANHLCLKNKNKQEVCCALNSYCLKPWLSKTFPELTTSGWPQAAPVGFQTQFKKFFTRSRTGLFFSDEIHMEKTQWPVDMYKHHNWVRITALDSDQEDVPLSEKLNSSCFVFHIPVHHSSNVS